jgi:hydroxymethylbilane synthase
VTDKLVIATRGSALALWQANHVKARITATAPGTAIELLVIKTSGDQIQDVPLAKVGGKGLFVKEIEQALVEGAADLAAPMSVPPRSPGLAIAACHAENRGRATRAKGRSTLPNGAKIGTSSMRRQVATARRPDLSIEMLRGNVPTRIKTRRRPLRCRRAAAAVSALGMAGASRSCRSRSAFRRSAGAAGIETRAGDVMVRQPQPRRCPTKTRTLQ